MSKLFFKHFDLKNLKMIVRAQARNPEANTSGRISRIRHELQRKGLP